MRIVVTLESGTTLEWNVNVEDTDHENGILSAIDLETGTSGTVI